MKYIIGRAKEIHNSKGTKVFFLYFMKYIVIKMSFFSFGQRVIKFCYTIRYGRVNGDPYEIIHIDPDEVNFVVSNDLYYEEMPCPPVFGIFPGEWDAYKTHYENHKVYNLIYERYVRNKNWKECEQYKKNVKKIKSGERMNTWDEIQQSETKYLEYLEEIDLLYESIMNGGYKQQKELKQLDKHIAKNRFSNSILNEISVDIDRNGEFMIAHGHHRVAIAKILDVSQIPVRIRVRHSKWAHIRERISKDNSYINSIENITKNHPDLKNLI